MAVCRGFGVPIVLTLLSLTVTPPVPAGTTSARPSLGRTGAGIARDGTVMVRIGGVSPHDPVVLPLLGVISGPDPALDSPAPNLTPQLHDIGIVTIRNNGYYDDRLDIERIFECPGGTTYPSWSGCDPEDDANYHWDLSDTQFQSFLDGGFEPFLRVGGEEQRGDRPHSFHGPQDREQEDNWIVAACRMAERYLRWTGSAPTYRYLDIWTEWPGYLFWDRSNDEFIAFWVRAFRALKAHFPDLRVGGPGIAANVTMDVVHGNPSLAADFLRALYVAGLRPDWLGWHLFSNDPSRFRTAAINYRHLLEGTGPYSDVPWAGTGYFSGVELLVDAYGLSSLKEMADGSIVPMTREEADHLYNHGWGAALLTASWIAMQYTEVTHAYYYRCGDPRSVPDADLDDPDSPMGWSGLYYGDPEGTPKPSAHAVHLWSTVVNGYPHLLQVANPAHGDDLRVLAARNDDGGLALLAANPADVGRDWTPVVTPGADVPQPSFGCRLFQVDDLHDGRTGIPVDGTTLHIPPESVQLVLCP